MNIIENKIYETFKDYRQMDGEGFIYLEPIQEIKHSAFVKYPIIWTGVINNEKIKIIQKTKNAYTENGFILETYPNKYEYLYEQIINLIDKYLKIKLR